MFGTKTKFQYRLSDEAQKRHLIETGQDIALYGLIELDLAQLTPQQRQRLLDYKPFLRWGGNDFVTFEIEHPTWSVPRINTKVVCFDTPPTVSEVFAHIDRMEAEYKAAQAQLAPLVASKSGSRRYHTTAYRVVVMTEAGELVRTDITTDDDKPGWQLRIRDQVANLVK